jgi:hypothetical protein
MPSIPHNPTIFEMLNFEVVDLKFNII